LTQLKNDTVCLSDICAQSRPRAHITVPQPFNLRLEKRKRELETATQNCYKFDTPLGEKILRFTSKTPERFKAKVQQKGLYCKSGVM